MKLRELCSEFKYECLSGSMDVDVRDVIYDSRKITEGTVIIRSHGVSSAVYAWWEL